MQGAPEAGGTLTLPEEPPPEAADRVQARLEETLKPPRDLVIALRGGDIELTSDDEPTRTLTPGRSLARMDSSGTGANYRAVAGCELVIRARHASCRQAAAILVGSPQRYLRIKLQVNDPAIGRMELQSVYRRKSPQA
jgi:hypothetical protein